MFNKLMIFIKNRKDIIFSVVKDTIFFIGIFMILSVSYYLENFYEGEIPGYVPTESYMFSILYSIVNLVVLLVLMLKNKKYNNYFGKFLLYCGLIFSFFVYLNPFSVISYKNTNYADCMLYRIVPLFMYLYLFEIIFHKRLDYLYSEKVITFLSSQKYYLINVMMFFMIIFYLWYFSASILGLIFHS